MNIPEESKRLQEIASDSWYAMGASTKMVEYSFKVFARHLRRGRILEMGPAEGVMTPYIEPLATHLTIVEGAKMFCEDLSRRFPKATVVHSLFEDYAPAGQFDAILLGHVLEHVLDPVSTLKRVRTWLAPDGRVIAAVPNARSIHRQAAVIIGLLEAEDAMNEMDRHHGHRRVYNPEMFRSHFIQAGFKIDVFGGYWLKPVSNKQIEQSWTPAMLDSFMQLGERYPDIAAEIYVVAC